MPAMIVWPVSSLYSERNDGSSRRIVTSASESFRLSSAVLGSIDIEITGSGNSIRSSTIGSFGSHSVSPVMEFLIPTTATILPAPASSSASRSFACISNMRDAISFLLFAGLSVRVPLMSLPE